MGHHLSASRCSRCIVLSALATAFLTAAAPDGPVSRNALGKLDLSSVRYWRMFTGADGNTQVEALRWPAKAMTELGSSHDIKQFFVSKAKSMIVISGKPGWVSPMHSVGKNVGELVLVLGGSSIGHFANGRTQSFHTGDIVLIQDQGSLGRSVEFGPQGYLAVTVPLDNSK